jgi:outer membrane cobalamin receptor
MSLTKCPRQRSTMRLALVIATLCRSSCIFAATPGDDDRELTIIPLEELVQIPVVTSASKFAQIISEAPSSVVVLTAADIRDFGWRTLADALATLPGLYVSNDRNFSYLGARGFLRPGDYNSRFLLLIDGVRVNDAVYDQALIGTEGLVDMSMVRRIEFVPGPGSAVYGSNALFGVINVIMRDGSTMPGAQASIAAGSYRERKATASYGWHSQSGADVLVAASVFARNGQDLYYPEFDTPDQNNGVAHRLDYDRAQNLVFKGAYGDFSLAANYVDRTKGVPTASFGVMFNTPDRTRDTQASVALAWNRRLSPQVALSAAINWGRTDYVGISTYADVDGPTVNVDGDHALWYGANVHATLTGFPGQKLVIGGEIGRDARQDQFNYNAAPYASLLDDRRSGARNALFVEDEIRLPGGFIVNAGVRYDRRSDSESRMSPRLAVLNRLSPLDTVKLIYGSAFRAPNAFEKYYALAGSGGWLANKDLRPERIATREIVLEHVLPGSGHATLSMYHYLMSDLINQELDADTGLLVFHNLDRATMNGAEAALERQFSGMRLRASFAWQLARNQGGAELADSPRRLAKINLAAPLNRSRAKLGSELVCSSPRQSVHGAVGGYCVSNLTMTVPRVSPNADLSLSLFNAFDKRYADVAGEAFQQDAIARQSRTLYAKLAYRF